MHRPSSAWLPALVLASTSALGCSASDAPATARTDADYRQEVVSGMRDSLLAELDLLIAAARDLQTAAPTPVGRGWDPAADATALSAMKDAWRRARTAYEHVEGALAPIFPEIDASLDARYDDFLAVPGAPVDTDPFDDQGVTGLHALERILYSDVTPPQVVAFEATLTGYQAARFPATEAEAAELKTKLCGRIVDDAQRMRDQWTPATIDIGGAFQGLISLMKEQREKVNKASTFEEESRYSQRTMSDLRDNLAGTRAIYLLFQPWLASKSNAQDPTLDGGGADRTISSGFSALGALYARVDGDAIPAPPPTWAAEMPSSSDLATPFGA